METCKYGSGAGKRKPTAVKRKGVVCRAYKPTRTYASGHTDVRMHKLTHIYVMTVGNKLLIQNLNNLIHIPTE